jgi:hypothetical protein
MVGRSRRGRMVIGARLCVNNVAWYILAWAARLSLSRPLRDSWKVGHLSRRVEWSKEAQG